MATHMDSVRRRGNRWAQLEGSKLGLTDAADLATLQDAYLVAYEFPAPLMVRVADDMLADLRADVGLVVPTASSDWVVTGTTWRSR